MGAQVGAWAEAAATVVRGHGVASGRSPDPRFAEGTIRPQLPFFRAAVPDLDAWAGGAIHPATINLALGRRWALATPELRLPDVRWSQVAPAETFFLSRAMLGRAGAWHPAWLYIPDPATKPDHHQPADVIELIAAPMHGLDYGERLMLRYRPGAITLATG